MASPVSFEVQSENVVYVDGTEVYGYKSPELKLRLDALKAPLTFNGLEWVRPLHLLLNMYASQERAPTLRLFGTKTQRQQSATLSCTSKFDGTHKIISFKLKGLKDQTWNIEIDWKVQPSQMLFDPTQVVHSASLKPKWCIAAGPFYAAMHLGHALHTCFEEDYITGLTVENGRASWMAWGSILLRALELYDKCYQTNCIRHLRLIVD